MLAALRARKEEEGFTLIELLVVVIIIGILAAIAIPVFLNQRKSAWIGTAESDARNAAIAIETALTRANSYPVDKSDLALGAWYIIPGAAAGDPPVWSDDDSNAGQSLGEVVVSENVTLDYSSAANSFRIGAYHANIDEDGDDAGDLVACYDSQAGGIQSDIGPCAPAPAPVE